MNVWFKFLFRLCTKYCARPAQVELIPRLLERAVRLAAIAFATELSLVLFFINPWDPEALGIVSVRVAQIFHSDIYTILMNVQTCEKLRRPHCNFFLAAQIFHSDIYTTLMKIQTCEVGEERGGLFTLRQHIYLHYYKYSSYKQVSTENNMFFWSRSPNFFIRTYW